MKTMLSIRLKEIMDKKGIKQIELSKKTGIPKSAISQYLSGSFEPKADRIYLIAKALNVDENYLMGYDILAGNNLTTIEQRVIDLLRSIPEEKREAFLKYLENGADIIK